MKKLCILFSILIISCVTTQQATKIDISHCGKKPIYKDDPCDVHTIYEETRDMVKAMECAEDISTERADFVTKLREYTACLEAAIKK